MKVVYKYYKYVNKSIKLLVTHHTDRVHVKYRLDAHFNNLIQKRFLKIL